MNRRTYLRRLGAGGLAATAVSAPAAATTHENGPSTGNESTANETGGSGTDSGSGGSGDGETHEVEMITEGGEFYFDPVGLHVQPGDTVRFVNASGSHSATSYSADNDAAGSQRVPEGAEGFNSGVLEAQDATYSYTFEVEGTYDYFCTPHKTVGMVGRIVCGEPGGPATEGSIPDAPGSGVMPSSGGIVDESSIGYPYVPSSGLQPLPWQFWAGISVFGLIHVYLFSKYDRESGRYSAENADE